MITDICVGGLFILAGLLIIIFAETINEFNRELHGYSWGINSYRIAGVVMILLGLRVICFGV